MTSYELYTVLGMGAVTFLIRVLPFLGIIPTPLLRRLEQKQAVFPIMFLTLLVIYCLSPVLSSPPKDGMTLIGCAALVAALQWWRSNLLLSLGAGTALYMYLMNG